MRTLAHRLLLFFTCLSVGASLWAIAQNPFAAPFVARSEAAAERALARAMAWRVTPDYIDAELRDALATKDYDRLQMMLDLANEHGISVDRQLLLDMSAFAKHEESTLAAVTDCAACAYDITACKRIADMAACALPVELSPLGDLNALRRAATDAAAGREVDRIDVGLALTGLAATTLAPASAGSSLTVKAGATLIRTARRIGALTAPFARALGQAADIPVQWAKLPGALLGRTPIDEVTDVAKLERLGDLAGDLGQVREATSTAEAIVLMRYIDTPEEAAKLAKVAKIEGEGTRTTLHVLGKSRTFRALNRLSRMALLALSLIATSFGLFLGLLSETLRLMLRPRNGRVA